MSRRIYPIILAKPCGICGGPIVIKASAFNKPNRAFCGMSCRAVSHNRNRIWTESARAKVRASMLKTRSEGKLNHHVDPDYIKAQSERYKGSKSHFWKGGLTKPAAIVRNSSAYSQWRKKVFDRDDYTCQACGVRGGILNADHELPFAEFPALRFEVLNGRTLCLSCHKNTPTFASKHSPFSLVETY